MGSNVRKAKHLLQSKLTAGKLGADPRFTKLRHCVEEQRMGFWAAEERAALAKVERLRASYEANQQTISVLDFGSGDATDTRSEQTMETGVVGESRICDVYETASSSPKNGEFMFRLIREFRPKLCFELGTCLGVSLAYGTQALELNGGGEYVSLEGSPHLAAAAKQNLSEQEFGRFSIAVGKFQDTLPGLFREHGEIDFAFIDGHHDEHATVRYFEEFFPHLADKSLLVFDDINWSPGMQRAWSQLKKDPRINYTLDNYFRGICIVDKNIDDKADYKVWF